MTSLIAKTLCAASLLGFAFSASSVEAQQAPQPAAPPKAGQSRPPQPSAPAAAPAPAAPTAPTGVKVVLKGAPDQNDWLKVCGDDPAIKKTVCYTTRDFVAENNQPVMALAFYTVKDDTRRFARFLVPLTFMIPPGIRFFPEGLAPVSARFQICLPQGCFVEAEMTDAIINALKKSNTLRIDMQNQIGQEVNFEVQMTGFGKVFDGPGIDQETLQKMQQEAQRGPAPGGAPPANAEELKKRAEDALKQRQQNAPKP